MGNMTISDEDKKSVVELAAKMQESIKKKIAFGAAAGSACRYILTEPKKLEELVLAEKKRA